MTTSIKVKILRRPQLKLRVLPRFPSSVSASSPIVRDSVGGSYSFSLDINALRASLDPFYAIVSVANNWTANQTFTGAGGITVDNIQIWSNYLTNTFIGRNSGANNVSAPTSHNGDGNTFIGDSAGQHNTSGFAQTFVGGSAGNAQTTGDSNTYIGYQSGIQGTVANANVGVGVDTLFTNVSGQDLTAVGHHTALGVTFTATNGQSTYVGAEANKVGVGAVGSTIMGYRAGYNVNASALGTSMFGYLSGFANTSGNQNSYFGQETGTTGTTASNNTFIGYRAGFSNVAGNGCVFIGNQAGFYETNSNTLLIDNTSRASAADARVKALIYGVFDALVANQSLTINGALNVVGIPTGPTAPVGTNTTQLATTAFVLANASNALPTRFWQGYQHSNNVGTPNTKIDVGAGSSRDSTDAINIVNSSGTIDCATVGANGLDAGTLAVSTWYYTFAITTAAGVTAFLASSSPTAPTLPATYTKFRRIGAFLTDASAHIIAFTHVNNIWTWASSPRDYNAIPTLDTATLATISVPRIQGIVAIFAATAFTSPAVATASTAYVYPGFMTSTARTGFALGSWANTNGVAQASRCQVDSSGRVNVFTHSAGTDPIKVVLDIAGWVDDL